MFKLNNFEYMEYMIEDYGLYCISKNLSDKTLKSYDQTLKLFALHLEYETLLFMDCNTYVLNNML